MSSSSMSGTSASRIPRMSASSRWFAVVYGPLCIVTIVQAAPFSRACSTSSRSQSICSWDTAWSASSFVLSTEKCAAL